MTDSQNKTIITLILAVVVVIILYGILTMPDNRTTAERVGDAVSELPDVDRAAEQLERRTPGERLGDAVEDTGDRIGENIREGTDGDGQ